MSARTPYKRSKLKDSLVPASRTATATGVEIDTQGWRWLRVLLHLGAWATDEGITLSLTTCATRAGSYVAVTDGPTYANSTTSGADGDKPKEFLIFLPTAANYLRYVKPVVTHTGGGSFVYGVTMEVLDPEDTDLATQTPNTTVAT